MQKGVIYIHVGQFRVLKYTCFQSFIWPESLARSQRLHTCIAYLNIRGSDILVRLHIIIIVNSEANHWKWKIKIFLSLPAKQTTEAKQTEQKMETQGGKVHLRPLKSHYKTFAKTTLPHVLTEYGLEDKEHPPQKKVSGLETHKT